MDYFGRMFLFNLHVEDPKEFGSNWNRQALNMAEEAGSPERAYFSRSFTKDPLRSQESSSKGEQIPWDLPDVDRNSRKALMAPE